MARKALLAPLRFMGLGAKHRRHPPLIGLALSPILFNNYQKLTLQDKHISPLKEINLKHGFRVTLQNLPFEEYIYNEKLF